MIDDNNTRFSTDTVPLQFDTEVDGISTDEDGDPVFDWNEIETVDIDNPHMVEGFGTDEFHRLKVTIARPIPQRYRYGTDELTLMKPREELKQAIWSLDNKPWTMGHPDTKLVRSVDQVRGFWQDSHYVDTLDSANSYLHIPTNDDEARTFIEENGDVSMGFTHKTVPVTQYDGVVGGNDDVDDVDGFQTDIYFDHVASVDVGRCSSEAGCGIHQDNRQETERSDGAFISETVITDDYRDEDGSDSADNNSEHDSMTEEETCTDCAGQGLDLAFEDLSVDAVVDTHEGIATRIDELQTEVDEKASRIEELETAVDEKDEELEDLRSTVDEYEAEERQELIDSITELTEAWDEDDLEDLSLDELSDRKEIVVEATADTSTVNGAGDDNEAFDYKTPKRISPWD